MSKAKYQSKTVNALYDLYKQWDQRLCQAGGMWGSMWVGLRIEVPNLLQMLDEDEGARKEIARFVSSFAKAMEEELSEPKELDETLGGN